MYVFEYVVEVIIRPVAPQYFVLDFDTGVSQNPLKKNTGSIYFKMKKVLILILGRVPKY